MIDLTQESAETTATRDMVTINGLEKNFTPRRKPSVHALGPINLTVESGSFVAILGPSGCGKSTLLRTLAGLEKPSAGTISIDGVDPAEFVKDHRLGIAFQEHSLLTWLNVVENLRMPFRIAGRPVDEDRITELVELVRLKGFEKSRPRELSGGMRQRVAIARSLVLEPELLLLDEPFGALDLVTRTHLNKELEQVWMASQTTTVLVTHSIAEAIELADRVVVLGPRPGIPVLDIPIEMPRPRATGEARTSQFHNYSDMIAAALR